MMLSPLSPKQLDNGLQIFGRLLENTPGAGRAFRRIAETRFLCPDMTADLFARHDQAVALARLFGMAILWEVELGGPAILAFCEQNWLELCDRPGTAEHFVFVFSSLRCRGLIGDDGRPHQFTVHSAAA